MSVTTARPTDRNRSTKIAIATVAVVAALTVVWDAISAFTVITGRSLTATGGADPWLPLSFLPQVANASLREGATGSLADIPEWLRLLCATPTIIHAVVLLLATPLIIRVIGRVGQGQPFAPSVLRSWSSLSVVLIVGGVLQGVLDTIAGRVLFNLTFTPEIPLYEAYEGMNLQGPNWPLLLIVVGIICVAITTAFRSGARLEKEVEGVV